MLCEFSQASCITGMSILCLSRPCSSFFLLAYAIYVELQYFSLFVLFIAVLPCVSCRFRLVVVKLFGVPRCGVRVLLMTLTLASESSTTAMIQSDTYHFASWRLLMCCSV